MRYFTAIGVTPPTQYKERYCTCLAISHLQKGWPKQQAPRTPCHYGDDSDVEGMLLHLAIKHHLAIKVNSFPTLAIACCLCLVGLWTKWWARYLRKSKEHHPRCGTIVSPSLRVTRHSACIHLQPSTSVNDHVCRADFSLIYIRAICTDVSVIVHHTPRPKNKCRISTVFIVKSSAHC